MFCVVIFFFFFKFLEFDFFVFYFGIYEQNFNFDDRRTSLHIIPGCRMSLSAQPALMDPQATTHSYAPFEVCWPLQVAMYRSSCMVHSPNS